MANSNEPQVGRQGVGDRGALTRSEVAARLGKHISWVRRHEGKLLHPTLASGVHRFDVNEVEALGRAMAAKAKESGAKESLCSDVNDLFVRHSELGAELTVESIAESTGTSVDVVRRMHRSWSLERRSAGEAVRPLLTRAKAAEAAQREIDAINREYDTRLAQYEAEHLAWEREVRARRRRWEQREAAAEKVAEAARRRRAEQRLARFNQPAPPPSSPEPDLVEHTLKLLESGGISEVAEVLRVLIPVSPGSGLK